MRKPIARISHGSGDAEIVGADLIAARPADDLYLFTVQVLGADHQLIIAMTTDELAALLPEKVTGE